MQAALSAESCGATNELVLMCDIHLHEILMRTEVCLYNEGSSSQTADQALQLVTQPLVRGVDRFWRRDDVGL